MRRSRPLPLGPLLRCYSDAGIRSCAELCQLPGFGPRWQAIQAAREAFLCERFIDEASEEDFQTTLLRFYEACVSPALHVAALARRSGLLRHALGHLLRSTDPGPAKVERFLAVDGLYRVPGLGPAFWSALVQALDPLRFPAWTPTVETGLRRMGLAVGRPQDSPGRVYARILDAYDHIRAEAPALTALHVDHFLGLVATMRGRDLFSGRGLALTPDLASVLRQERTRQPLRQRLKERGAALDAARNALEAALAVQDGMGIGAALAVADPAGHRSAPLDWRNQGETLTLWVGRLWEADDPWEMLEAFWRAEPLPGAGLWLPAAVLHLQDPSQFPLWSDAARKGYELLDDSVECGLTTAESYRLFCAGVARLRELQGLHPFEMAEFLAALVADASERREEGQQQRFGGFCTDTFRFLAELEVNNRRDWMMQHRDRYQFAVRDPLIELCRALADRYVEPVLHRAWGWHLETTPRSGRALTSICKNDFARSVPYHTTLWITFYRRAEGRRSGAMQFFVRLSAAGLAYGLCLGRAARDIGQHLRRAVQEHADLLHHILATNGALSECRFGTVADLDEVEPTTASDTVVLDMASQATVMDAVTPSSPDANRATPDTLRNWAALAAQRGLRTPLAVFKTVAAHAPLVTLDDLVGDILLTFDRLLPLYACAVEADPLPFFARHSGTERTSAYTDAEFRRATFLGDDWLRRARTLLGLKRQLMLQGVPGTGKTHVARCLARLLTGGRDDAVRLVQFHPAYSYEEFVEGIKVRSVEVNGRHDVSYPVEDGLLCAFAEEAARRPAEPYVLVIDEINRSNLPRVFGELLYLLEYREQSIRLPYSKREFRLPANLYVLSTMNAADRSVALVDQALRRRFSFLDMPPDAEVLRAWLRSHPPPRGVGFADAVVRLFERLNGRLRADLGPAFQVGHSYFMVADLDEARLRVIWQHQVGPLLDEYFAGQPGRAAAYELEKLITEGHPRRRPEAATPS